jgi:hypothetical protein
MQHNSVLASTALAYLPALDPYAVGRVREQAGVDLHVLDHVGGPVLAEASDAMLPHTCCSVN